MSNTLTAYAYATIIVRAKTRLTPNDNTVHVHHLQGSLRDINSALEKLQQVYYLEEKDVEVVTSTINFVSI